MTCAVMQTGLEAPSTEQLKNAFREVQGLTGMDAAILGKNACGILVKGFELEQALAMKSALLAQGVETEVVEESALTELPPPQQLMKVEWTPEALQIFDLQGRSFPLKWSDISVIAAGRVPLTEFKTELMQELKITGQNEGMPKLVTTKATTETKEDHWLLEIITRGAALRYHTMADRPETRLLFQCLGARLAKDPAANLSLFVQELAKFAPAAALNHGAFLMRENNDSAFSYPSQTSFYREITWLLWLVSTGRMSP